MNKKSILNNLGFLIFLTTLSALLAATSIAICYFDNFRHPWLMLILYLLLIILIITIGISFKNGKKEIMKASTASLFTLILVLHSMSFIDISNNFYYFLSGSIIQATIGIIAVLLFILILFAYINHYKINATNESNTKLVKINIILLVIISIFCLAETVLIIYNDYITGREYELFTATTYVLHFTSCLILATVESMIDMFRTARMEGKLDKAIKATIGKKAAKANKPKTKKGKKTK